MRAQVHVCRVNEWSASHFWRCASVRTKVMVPVVSNFETAKLFFPSFVQEFCLWMVFEVLTLQIWFYFLDMNSNGKWNKQKTKTLFGKLAKAHHHKMRPSFSPSLWPACTKQYILFLVSKNSVDTTTLILGGPSEHKRTSHITEMRSKHSTMFSKKQFYCEAFLYL